MKKTSLILVTVVAVLISLVSCKKDYTCVCAYKPGVFGIAPTKNVTVKTTKSKASSECTKKSDSEYDCKLK